MGFPRQVKCQIGLLDLWLFTHVSRAPKRSSWFLNKYSQYCMIYATKMLLLNFNHLAACLNWACYLLLGVNIMFNVLKSILVGLSLLKQYFCQNLQELAVTDVPNIYMQSQFCWQKTVKLFLVNNVIAGNNLKKMSVIQMLSQFQWEKDSLKMSKLMLPLW